MSSTGWIAPSSAAARCNGMELLDKLAILTDAAKYDAACTSSGVRRSARPGMIGNTTSSIAGCCHSFSADGRCITLLKVLMTNSCVYRLQVLRQPAQQRYPPRAAFTPRELAELTIGFYRRNYIEGLFLSSGVLRKPGLHHRTDDPSACGSCGRSIASTGISMPRPSPAHRRSWCSSWGCWQTGSALTSSCPLRQGLQTLAPDKSKQAILRPHGHRSGTGPARARQELVKSRHAPAFAPAGQSTQLIVGATPDNDRHILHLTQALYEKYRLKRVFYSAYVPVVENSLLPSKDTKPPSAAGAPPVSGGLAAAVLRLPGRGAAGRGSTRTSIRWWTPSASWAIGHLEQFPVEVMQRRIRDAATGAGHRPDKRTAYRLGPPPWYAAVRGPEKTGGGAEEGAVLYHLRRPDAAGPAIYRPDPSVAIRGDGARAAAAGRVPAAVTV